MGSHTRQKKMVHMSCPYCGTTFLAAEGQKEGLCFNCGRRILLAVQVRDARAKDLGFGSYDKILETAKTRLQAQDYPAAKTYYEKAVLAAPDDYDACFGLLVSETHYFQEFSGRLPTREYRAALSCAEPAAARKLTEAWTKYEREYTEYYRARRRAAEEKRREDEKLKREREKAAKETPRNAGFFGQDAKRAGSANAGERRDGGGKRMPVWQRVLVVFGGCILLGLAVAACTAMGGGSAFLFFMAIGLFGANRRRNDGE